MPLLISMKYGRFVMDYPTCCKYGHLFNDLASSGKDPDWLFKNKHQDIADVAIPYFLKHHLIQEHPDDAPQRFTLTRQGQALLATFKAHWPRAASYDGKTVFNTAPPEVSEQDLVNAFPK